MRSRLDSATSGGEAETTETVARAQQNAAREANVAFVETRLSPLMNCERS